MTLAEMIAAVDKLRPNAFDKDQKTGWINEVEHRAYHQVISRALWHDEAFYGPYEYERDAERELLIEDAHKDVYETYLLARMDHANAEIDRYNMDASMHQAAWDDYARDFRRRNYPKPYETAVFTIGNT